MRYIIIFGLTILISLFLIFYHPYLGVYKNNITIEYDFKEEGYTWNYISNNNCLKLVSKDDNKFVFEPNKNGKIDLVFSYSNEVDTKYEINYKFKIKGNKIYWLEGIGTGLFNYPNPY